MGPWGGFCPRPRGPALALRGGHGPAGGLTRRSSHSTLRWDPPITASCRAAGTARARLSRGASGTRLCAAASAAGGSCRCCRRASPAPTAAGSIPVLCRGSPSPGVSVRAMGVGWGEAPPEQGMLPRGAAQGLGGEAHPPHQLRASGPFPSAPSAAAPEFGANCWPRFSCSTLVRWRAGLTAPPGGEVTPGAPQQEPGPCRTLVPLEMQDAGDDPRGAMGEGTGRSPAKSRGSEQAVTQSWALPLPGNCSCACPRLEKSGKMQCWDMGWFRSCLGLGAGSLGPCFLLPASIPVETSPGD